MSFASPIAFALAVVAVPIVVFYILKVRLRRVRVSTNLFWRQIYDEKPPRSIWQYLRHLLSLLAQLFLVLLLVLAVADPYFSWQLLQARRVVAVIDNSASMQASDVLPSRFAAAISAAVETVDGLRFRDEMAIVLAGPEPEVVIGMSSHSPTLKRALRSIRVTDNPTQLTSAIALGRKLVGDHPHAEVLVFTDGCAETSRGRRQQATNAPPVPNPTTDGDLALFTPVEQRIPVHQRVLGSTNVGNIGITQFQVRRSLVDPIGYEVLVAAKNASSQAVTGRLEITLNNVPVDVLPLNLEPDELFTRSLEKTTLEGGTLVARLTNIQIANRSGDTAPGATAGTSAESLEPSRVNALPTDDVAWAVLPARQLQDVLIITKGNLFLQKVFEANPLVRVTVQAELPDSWPLGSIVVLHRDVPSTLPDVNLFIVEPLGSCDAWELGDKLSNPIITQQDKNSNLMSHVRLDNVLMPEARQLKFVQEPHVLAGALSTDPIYAELRRRSGKCLVLSVNIDEGDLAFRTAFPIMVTNALGWFAGQSGELRPSLATGAVTDFELANSNLRADQPLRLRSPTGRSRILPVTRHSSVDGNSDNEAASPTPWERPPHISIPPLNECGIWSILPSDAGIEDVPIAELAVNLADLAETDIRTPAESLEQDPIVSVASWFSSPIWFYLTVIACLVAVTEWWLYQRRVIT